jgi:hypothetical protein
MRSKISCSALYVVTSGLRGCTVPDQHVQCDCQEASSASNSRNLCLDGHSRCEQIQGPRLYAARCRWITCILTTSRYVTSVHALDIIPNRRKTPAASHEIRPPRKRRRKEDVQSEGQGIVPPRPLAKIATRKYSFRRCVAMRVSHRTVARVKQPWRDTRSLCCSRGARPASYLGAQDRFWQPPGVAPPRHDWILSHEAVASCAMKACGLRWADVAAAAQARDQRARGSRRPAADSASGFLCSPSHGYHYYGLRQSHPRRSRCARRSSCQSTRDASMCRPVPHFHALRATSISHAS